VVGRPADAAWDRCLDAFHRAAVGPQEYSRGDVQIHRREEKDLEPGSAAAQQLLVRRYSACMDYVRTLAGIVQN
jgi:hypothetical protein